MNSFKREVFRSSNQVDYRWQLLHYNNKIQQIVTLEHLTRNDTNYTRSKMKIHKASQNKYLDEEFPREIEEIEIYILSF